jgi:hypothetical protein
MRVALAVPLPCRQFDVNVFGAIAAVYSSAMSDVFIDR